MTLEAARRAFEPAIRRVLHFYWRFARTMTLGVRALVIDREGRVFLVKHSYVSGWHLPGGGVEAGETLTEALARELREEGNIELSAPPRLHQVFFNDRDSRRDHGGHPGAHRRGARRRAAERTVVTTSRPAATSSRRRYANRLLFLPDQSVVGCDYPGGVSRAGHPAQRSPNDATTSAGREYGGQRQRHASGSRDRAIGTRPLAAADLRCGLR